MPNYSSVAAALAASSLRQALDQLADLAAIRAIVEQALSTACPTIDRSAVRPDASEHDLARGQLVLTVRSGAEAAKLRQALPQLKRSLRLKGFHLTEIRLRVQPAPADIEGTPDAAQKPVTAFTDADRTAALAFAEHLARAAPDSGLGQAAGRLADSLRRD